MPVGRLGLLVLADVDRTSSWNWRNWMLSFAADRSSAQLDAARNALAEAWGWLQARTLVSTKGSGGSYDFHDVHITRAGREALSGGLEYVRAVIRLDVVLMPELEHRVRPQFLLGEFELAAFAAMREVEIAVRDLGGFSVGHIGVDLMNQAFKPGGPLFDAELHKGESVAQMSLFAGDIGLFKNPVSHRRVDYQDPVEASGVILLADLLLRLLRRSAPTVDAGMTSAEG